MSQLSNMLQVDRSDVLKSGDFPRNEEQSEGFYLFVCLFVLQQWMNDMLNPGIPADWRETLQEPNMCEEKSKVRSQSEVIWAQHICQAVCTRLGLWQFSPDYCEDSYPGASSMMFNASVTALGSHNTLKEQGAGWRVGAWKHLSF